MLILSRKVNDVIVLTIPPSTETRTVEVMITEIGRAVIRLGLEAPDEIKIFRKELIETPHASGLTKAV